MQAEVAIDESKAPGGTPEVLWPIGGFSTKRGSARPSWNVRAVGFIAKPEKTRELKACIEGPVTRILQGVAGFAGAIVLHSQSDGRNVLVLTFWETESRAAKNCWEEFKEVRGMISPLVDVCTRVQTFRATATRIAGGSSGRKTTGILESIRA